MFHCFPFETTTFKSNYETNDKNNFSARAGIIHLRSCNV